MDNHVEGANRRCLIILLLGPENERKRFEKLAFISPGEKFTWICFEKFDSVFFMFYLCSSQSFKFVSIFFACWDCITKTQLLWGRAQLQPIYFPIDISHLFLFVYLHKFFIPTTRKFVWLGRKVQLNTFLGLWNYFEIPKSANGIWRLMFSFALRHTSISEKVNENQINRCP